MLVCGKLFDEFCIAATYIIIDTIHKIVFIDDTAVLTDNRKPCKLDRTDLIQGFQVDGSRRSVEACKYLDFCGGTRETVFERCHFVIIVETCEGFIIYP